MLGAQIVRRMIEARVLLLSLLPAQDVKARPRAISAEELKGARRRRSMDEITIPDKYITVTDEVLGRGGFATVFLGDYNGRNVAIKLQPLHVDLSEREGGEKSETGSRAQDADYGSTRGVFVRELAAMMRLRNPYVVHLFGAIVGSGNRIGLVMELMSGGDLRLLLSRADEPLPDRVARQIIEDICAGVSFLHSKETVHGDLKSANVLLDWENRAKVSQK